MWYKDDLLLFNGTNPVNSSHDTGSYKLQHKVDIDYEKGTIILEHGATFIMHHEPQQNREMCQFPRPTDIHTIIKLKIEL